MIATGPDLYRPNRIADVTADSLYVISLFVIPTRPRVTDVGDEIKRLTFVHGRKAPDKRRTTKSGPKKKHPHGSRRPVRTLLIRNPMAVKVLIRRIT